MQNTINIFILPFLYICLIGTPVYCLWDYLDKKRVSGPNYRRDVTNARQLAAAELARAKALKSRPTEFPKPHDPAGILKFVLCKLNHAEQCAEVVVGAGADISRGCCKGELVDVVCGYCRGESADMDCRGEAAVCIAEALYVLSSREADVMLEHAKCTLPPETYSLVCTKYAELKKNACR